MAALESAKGDNRRAMTWPQIVALVVPISAAIIAGIGVLVLNANAIHSQISALQIQAAADRAEAAADRRAWQATMATFRAEMLRLAERQSHVEGRFDERGTVAD